MLTVDVVEPVDGSSPQRYRFDPTSSVSKTLIRLDGAMNAAGPAAGDIRVTYAAWRSQHDRIADLFRGLTNEQTMATHTVEIVVPEDADLPEAGETVEITVDESETILGVARASGVWLPADCQQGWCTTCAARLEEGEVDQLTARRYYAVDEERDFVLTCTAKPRSDLRIVACQHDAILDHRAAHDLPPGSSKR